MKHSQLYKLIAPLSAGQRKDLMKWLDWRLGRKDRNLLPMLEQMLRDPDRKKVWKAMDFGKAYPKEEAKDQLPRELRKKMTALKKLVEEYFASLRLRDDQYYIDLNLLNYLNESGHEDFMIHYRRMLRSYERGDGEYHRQLALMSQEHRYYWSDRQPQQEKNLWEEMQDHFSIAYRHRFLELYMGRLNNRKLPADTKPMADFSLASLHDDPLVQNQPSLKIMYQLCLLLHGQLEDWQGFIRDFKAEYKLFEPYMQQNIFICIENHIQAHIRENTGQNAMDNHEFQSLLQERFAFYQWGEIAKQVCYENRMNYKRYASMVLAALELGQFEIATQWLERYQSKLTLRNREQAYHIVQAYCLMAKDQLDELSKEVFVQNFHNPAFKLLARLLHCQARFDRGERAELETVLQSLKTYCQRTTSLPKVIKDRTYKKARLFLKFLETYKIPKLQKLLTEARTINDYHFRRWLITKLLDRIEGREKLF